MTTATEGFVRGVSTVNHSELVLISFESSVLDVRPIECNTYFLVVFSLPRLARPDWLSPALYALSFLTSRRGTKNEEGGVAVPPSFAPTRHSVCALLLAFPVLVFPPVPCSLESVFGPPCLPRSLLLSPASSLLVCSVSVVQRKWLRWSTRAGFALSWSGIASHGSRRP